MKEKFNLENILISKIEDIFGKTREDALKKLDGTKNGIAKINELHEIKEILKSRHIGRKLDGNCKNCGGENVYCGYADLGGLDYYDNFWHICADCLDASHTEHYVMLGYESSDDGECPFCGYDWIHPDKNKNEK